MVGRILCFMLFLLVLVPMCEAETKIAGGMSETTICQTVGYIIKRTLGDKFKPYDIPCSVTTTDGREIEIRSGYESPLGPTLYYTARGIVYNKNLRLTHIKIHGIDEDFITFREFAGH